jgi:hypothetical protein
MFAVIWEIDGFHVVDLMSRQHSYNTPYFLSHSLEPLMLAVFLDSRKSHSRRLILHLDFCRAHHSKASESFFVEKAITRVAHSLKIRLFEYPIRVTVPTWHRLTSGFSST